MRVGQISERVHIASSEDVTTRAEQCFGFGASVQ